MKDLGYYMNLPYELVVRPMEGGGYYARYPELETPHGDGPTPAEAIADADVSKELFFESCLEHGDPILEPGQSYSGKFNVRVPKSLHRQLALEAEREGVSLNMLIVSRLSAGRQPS